METFCGNSFFCQDYHALNVMLIVPHQDDEINTAGALIPTLSKSGAKITLVYTTNGDWKYPAETRIKEAVKAAGVLGIKSDHIIFLGYGDAINNTEHNHLFYHSEPVRSSAGRDATYGSKAYPDYFYQKTGKHHEYTNTSFLKDIVDVIREHHPDLIICTDFDEHPDHRMLALYLDKAVGILRRAEPTYIPEIWKRFAYSTGYTAEADYSAYNNPETKRPKVGVTGKYEWELIDASMYCWDSRIRVPIPEEARVAELKKNLLATALNQHKSQYIITRADRIINSDEVYWSRRTDSIAYSAEVTVSSGEGHFLNDFVIYDTDDVDSVVPDLSGHAWKPDDSDKEKRAVLRWQSTQHIEKIILYGEITDDSGIEKLRLRLNDGYERIVSNIPCNGNPMVIDTGEHDGITECIVEIIMTNGAGLTEIEVYSRKRNRSHIMPYVKILIEDNFAYEYVADRSVEELELGLYQYGDVNATIRVAKGQSRIEDKTLLIAPEDKTVVLQAVTEDGRILDQVDVSCGNKEQLSALDVVEKLNASYLLRMKRKMKYHNMIYILKHDGVVAVVKRTIRNIIRPKLMRK